MCGVYFSGGEQPTFEYRKILVCCSRDQNLVDP